MNDVWEYDCLDCGVHVFLFGAVDPPSPQRCATCRAIRDVAPGYRRDLRATLYDRDAMDHWCKVGCYADEDYPERPCDNPACGRLYRGPGVYCCLPCAEADR